MELIMSRVARVTGVISGTALTILLGSTAQVMAQSATGADTGEGAPPAAAAAPPPMAAAITFDPSSIDLTGKVSPAFGPSIFTFSTEYDAFGVHFSVGPPSPVPTAAFTDPPVAWGGETPGGIVDLIASVDGQIVVPGTGGTLASTNSISVEAGFAAAGNLLLEVFDCTGALVGSRATSSDGTGTNGRRLMNLAGVQISAFRVSTPAGDTFGVDEIVLDDPTACVIPIDIDIKPGSFPNSINLGSGGATPVAILGSTTFDVLDIDEASLTLGTAGIKTVGKKDPHLLCSIEDVSGDFSGGPEGIPDGYDDLVCHFITVGIVPEAGDTEAKLSGNLFDGTPIEGSDSVQIVP